MLRRTSAQSGFETSGHRDATAAPVPLRDGPPERSRDAAGGFAARVRAAGVHLLLTGILAAAVLALVLGLWYPDPLHRLFGVGAILAIVIGVDLVLGPLLTLLVFDRRKPRLMWDLAAIAVLQLVALGYGLHTVYQGRPAFVVFVKDRFEMIAPADLREAERAAARDNPHARALPTGPRWVAARMPESSEELARITLEAIAHGRDVQHHPRLYVGYEDEAAAVVARALPIERLRALNPAGAARIDQAVRATGRPETALRYLPLRGRGSDGAVLIGHPDARVLATVPLMPW
jgi:hypothetical protein